MRPPDYDQSKKQSGTAGFDYYLNKIQEKKEENRRSIESGILRILAQRGGKMRFIELASEHLGDRLTGDALLTFTDTIRRMQDTDLIALVGVQGESEETGVDNLKIRITPHGKKALEAQLGFDVKF